jgi:hypothetical protein
MNNKEALFNKKFRYSFGSSYTLMDSSRFSFKKLKMNEFFTEILYKLDSNYINLTWTDIYTKNHFHQIKKDTIEKICPNILTKSEGQNLYQLALNKKARLIGFLVNDVFHIVAYDQNHELYNMS